MVFSMAVGLIVYERVLIGDTCGVSRCGDSGHSAETLDHYYD